MLKLTTICRVAAALGAVAVGIGALLASNLERWVGGKSVGLHTPPCSSVPRLAAEAGAFGQAASPGGLGPIGLAAAFADCQACSQTMNITIEPFKSPCRLRIKINPALPGRNALLARFTNGKPPLVVQNVGGWYEINGLQPDPKEEVPEHMFRWPPGRELYLFGVTGPPMRMALDDWEVVTDEWKETSARNFWRNVLLTCLLGFAFLNLLTMGKDAWEKYLEPKEPAADPPPTVAALSRTSVQSLIGLIRGDNPPQTDLLQQFLLKVIVEKIPGKAVTDALGLNSSDQFVIPFNARGKFQKILDQFMGDLRKYRKGL